MSEQGGEVVPIPYGKGTARNGGCDECWQVPSRICCMWNEPDGPEDYQQGGSHE